MTDEKDARIEALSRELYNLTESQIGWVESVIHQFGVPHQYTLHAYDCFDQCMLDSLGDALQIHHCFSKEAFSKDKFEYVLERVANFCGKSAQIARRGNLGHDITIDDVRFSLKTQADSNINQDEIYISKFMELGKGKWGDNPKDLEGLRDQFINHMRSYDRIFSLRCLSRAPNDWLYELVEIPKLLLIEASDGHFEMKLSSPQSPKPGYCSVRDPLGNDKFQLYFDGGSERKLQIRHSKKTYCIVHATWQFPAVELNA